MEETILKSKKTKTPKVTTKVTKVSSILDFSNKAKKSSIKLRKTFEKGIYQKRTQLSILDRYKKRLDQIEKEDERATKRKSKRKVKLPQIKKFAGNFFSPGSSDDPLKAIGALAAFKAATRASSGDLSGAIPPALIAGLMFGAPLIGGAAGSLFNRNRKIPRGFDVTGRRVSPRSRERYRRRFGDKNFKNRFGQDDLRRSKNKSPVKNIGRGSRVVKSFGKFGAAIVPGLGAVVGAADATLRAQSGDITGSAIAGTSASLDAAAAASAATGIGLPIAGLLSIGSFALDLVNLSRDLLGFSEREEERNKKKKEEKVEGKSEDSKTKKSEVTPKNTFGKTLEGYSKSIDKFKEFAEQFKEKNISIFPDPPVLPPGSPLDVPQNVEGAQIKIPTNLSVKLKKQSELPSLPPTGTGGRSLAAAQQYGAPRNKGGRQHAGQDFDAEDNGIFYSRIGGVVKRIEYQSGGGYGNYVDIYNKELDVTERIAEGDANLVKVGQTISPGTPIQKGTSQTGVFHYEIRKGEEETYGFEGTLNPTIFLNELDNKLDNKKNSDRSSQDQAVNIDSEKSMRFRDSLPRNIAQYPSYDQRGMGDQVIPVSIPIPSQQPKTIIQNSSQPLLIGGLTEEEVLNSYYKRVLLNTLV